MENISSALIDMIPIIVLGAIGLAVFIAAIIGIPYTIGITMLRLRIMIFGPIDRQKLDPWLIGLGSIGIGCLLWLIGTTIRWTLKP